MDCTDSRSMETLVKYAVFGVQENGRSIPVRHYADYLKAVIEDLQMMQEAAEYDRRSVGDVE